MIFLLFILFCFWVQELLVVVSIRWVSHVWLLWVKINRTPEYIMGIIHYVEAC
jgi:hypothetical protein